MLSLKEINKSHTDFVLKLNNDPIFSKSFPRKKEITPEEHLNFLNYCQKKGDFYYIIYQDDLAIGTVSIYDIDTFHSRAEWGRFIILPEYQTYGLLVTKMIIKKAFTELNLRKLYCQILATNRKVIALNMLLGFKEEGVLKEHILKDNSFIDLVFLAKYNPDWGKNE